MPEWAQTDKATRQRGKVLAAHSDSPVIVLAIWIKCLLIPVSEFTCPSEISRGIGKYVTVIRMQVSPHYGVELTAFVRDNRSEHSANIKSTFDKAP